MSEPPVVNSSPLVVLARAGRLDLLRLLGDRVVIPEAVPAEVESHSDEAARAIEVEAWIDVVRLDAIPAAVTAWDLRGW